MTNFATSLVFFAEVLAAATLFRLAVPRLPAAVRPALLIGSSLLFLGQLEAHPAFLLATAAYAAVAAGAAAAIGRVPRLKADALAVSGAILLAVFVLLLVKYRYYSSLLLGGMAALPGLSGFEWLGLSYMTFRAIDLTVQAKRGREAPSPLAAAAFLLFFPAYLAGPINRFQDFVRDLGGPLPVLGADDYRDIALRLAGGVVKVLLLAEVFRANSLIGVGSTEGMGPAAILAGLYCQFAYIYFDFSGYSDVAIAVARLFGIRLPENFNFPFLSRNLQDFWNRWHITFAQWCRDYIYFVLLRWFRLKARWLSDVGANLAAIFVTFFFMGAWHGDGLNWLLYGLYHGAGMSALVVGRRAVPPELSDRLSASSAFRALSVATTVTFVSLGLLLTHNLPFAREAAGQLLGLGR
ncbi:MAG: hypothetical protein H7841_03955 [Magnetospirillum sp. WYHS-4]